MGQNNITGKTGEEIAVEFLTAKGYKILHTNYRNGRYEVDIIAEKNKTLHIMEVKTKAGKGLGLPEQRVNTQKITRMKRVAENYCFENPEWAMVQFNIISIILGDENEHQVFMIEDVY